MILEEGRVLYKEWSTLLQTFVVSQAVQLASLPVSGPRNVSMATRFVTECTTVSTMKMKPTVQVKILVFKSFF